MRSNGRGRKRKEKKSLLARVSYYNNSLRKFFERNWFKLDYVYF